MRLLILLTALCSFSALAVDCRGPAFEAVEVMTKVNFPEQFQDFSYGLQGMENFKGGKKLMHINAILQTQEKLIIEAFEVRTAESENGCAILDIRVKSY